jgi:hypothetical protein
MIKIANMLKHVCGTHTPCSYFDPSPCVLPGPPAASSPVREVDARASYCSLYIPTTEKHRPASNA